MKKQTFIQGAMILLAAGIINRILGFIPRIALPRVIGAEGVGIYQLSYPFFIVLVTLITGGIPLAVAKLVAEAETGANRYSPQRILQISLSFTLTLGVVFMFLCIVFAPWITRYVLTDERVYHTFVSMSPMIAIIAVSAVYRGYFQGKQNMMPTAVSSIVETIIRIICVIWFAWLLLPHGIEHAAAGAMLGAMVGELGGMLVLLWNYARARKELPLSKNRTEQPIQKETSQGGLIRRLLAISVPVTAGRLVGSLSYLAETIVTAQSLAIAGIAKGLATAQYGALQGMVIPLLLLPGALTSSLATSLVPSLSEASARGDRALIHKRMHQALRLALVTGAPFSVFMYVLAEPMCLVLYNDASIGSMLKLMAPFALFIYIQAPLQAALQALDRPGKALLNTFIGAVIKISLILMLASQPEYGIFGAVIAICINSMVVTLLHARSVRMLLNFRFKLLDWVKTGAGMFIMGAATLLVYEHTAAMFPFWLRMILAPAVGLMVYLLIMGMTKMIDFHDLSRTPIIGSWFKRRSGK
ncbi:stage V sporulation protein B [Paenibacillus silvae]|uniref:stage V sporulation protein B n=1 Tax=Paenibacillus silvae TaxID=1325358 RepID=UPI0011A7D0FD|nr:MULTISPECIES: stage V sporulation protein B [Paenibacillus]MCK6074935.1 stage V sporulation protein B [Paenibacillus silvae]MCK6149322.1 stage V sporulation protein B [Paenibacillus silvae]MCK6267621.1 stage V sporulation protein B [Paenibacillus silvae]